MKFVKVDKNGAIILPKEVRKSFPALSELAIWWKGDALVLKRVAPFLPSEFAERLPKKGLSLKMITKEIHKIRKA